jgi:hypothetical protein
MRTYVGECLVHRRFHGYYAVCSNTSTRLVQELLFNLLGWLRQDRCATTMPLQVLKLGTDPGAKLLFHLQHVIHGPRSLLLTGPLERRGKSGCMALVATSLSRTGHLQNTENRRVQCVGGTSSSSSWPSLSMLVWLLPWSSPRLKSTMGL